jgi:hypothetical protein
MNGALDLSGDRHRAGVHVFVMVLIAPATFLAIGMGNGSAIDRRRRFTTLWRDLSRGRQ